MKLKTLGVAMAMTAALATGAGASTSIDFSNISPNGSPIGPFDFGGLDLTVTADTFNRTFPLFPLTISLNNNVNAQVTVDAEGLGVDNGGRPNPLSDDVDGRNNNDILLFDFGGTVDLSRIDFDNEDSNDGFVFFAADTLADLVGPISTLYLDIQADGPFDEGFFNFASEIRGRFFGIGAIRDRDNFRVEGLTATVVPLPAALPLLAGGLGILGLAGWRRRNSVNV